MIYERYGETYEWKGKFKQRWLKFNGFLLRLREGDIINNDNEVIDSVWIDLPIFNDDYEETCILLYINKTDKEATLFKFYPFKEKCLRKDVGLADKILKTLDIIMSIYKVIEARLTDGLTVDDTYISPIQLYNRGYSYYNRHGWMPINKDERMPVNYIVSANKIMNKINDDRLSLSKDNFIKRYQYKYILLIKQFIYIEDNVFVTTINKGKFIYKKLHISPLLIGKSLLK